MTEDAHHWGQKQDEAARLQYAKWLDNARHEGLSSSDNEVASATQRLGYRFEHCIQTWFNFHPEWTVLAANYVIQLGKQTAGEIDLILGQDQECLHLELAVKFYLSSAGSRCWETWLGIDPTDRLDLKLAKFQQQLHLSEDPKVARILRDQGWQIEERRAWMKGWFFEHYSRIAAPVLPDAASRTCQVGWWCHEGEWKEIWSAAGNWVVLQPMHWLRVRHAPSDVDALVHAPTLPPKSKKSTAWMVAQVVRDGEGYREINRGVVVPNRWPQV